MRQQKDRLASPLKHLGAVRGRRFEAADFSRWPASERVAGKELPTGAEFVHPDECGGCSGHGRCMVTARGGKRCWCLFGAYGKHCETICSNDCVNDCSGHGRCLHGFCACDAGFYGLDCSSNQLGVPRSSMSGGADLLAHGAGVASAKAAADDAAPLPPSVARLVQRARRMVYVYDLPPRLNRAAAAWSIEFWGNQRAEVCTPVHNRRVYQGQAHFDAHLHHDDFVRTLDPSEASLFYVPALLLQRTTWGASPRPHVQKALDYIRGAFPYWNRTSGRDHVWYFFHENHCDLPDEVVRNSIVLSSWGGATTGGNRATDCMSRGKDIVVPTVTPMSHDRGKADAGFRAMFEAAGKKASDDRAGPLLFFAGGVVGYGAAQEHHRRGGADPAAKREKVYQKVLKMPCALPTGKCRTVYSMGVRQAVWRARLWEERDVHLVSAGVKDYADRLLTSHFCLHTEGNGWGTRLIDYSIAECVPLIINDDMQLIFEDLIPYPAISVRARKADIPTIVARLRQLNDTALREQLRVWRRAFSWWRPIGWAYEFTVANLVMVAHRRGLLKGHS